MTSTADLLTVLYDIDRLRGRICGTCRHHLQAGGCLQFNGPCRLGHQPYGADDGCDDWSGVPTVTPVQESS